MHRCRLCGAQVSRTFVDLGMSPLCESFLSAEQARQMESTVAAQVGDLGAQLGGEFARRLWVVPPGGSLL